MKNPNLPVGMRRAAVLGALCAVVVLMSGCIGIYSNKDKFRVPPSEGMGEVEMLRQYGKPAFHTTTDRQKVYIYEVRDNKYVILIGIYKGHDLVVTTQGGTVNDVTIGPRQHALSLFHPVPWAESK